LELRTLLYADILRDGGSFEASFATDDGPEYGLLLQRSAAPDARGVHHRWLFEFRGPQKPLDAIPVVTGSPEEQRIIGRLVGFLAAAGDSAACAAATIRLGEMLEHIRRRELSVPADLRRHADAEE
jgi:hypothetical protein